MKTTLAVIFGFVLALTGEAVIPRAYQYGQTVGCLKDGRYVYMPRAYMYVDDEVPYGLVLESGVVPSYYYLYLQATGHVSWLPDEECNKKVEQLIQDEEKHWAKIFQDRGWRQK